MGGVTGEVEWAFQAVPGDLGGLEPFLRGYENLIEQLLAFTTVETGFLSTGAVHVGLGIGLIGVGCLDGPVAALSCPEALFAGTELITAGGVLLGSGAYIGMQIYGTPLPQE
jgi:hypothetical protein